MNRNMNQRIKNTRAAMKQGTLTLAVAAALAFGILEEFTAAPHCAAILAEHPEWGLAELFADEATPAAE